MDINLNYKPKNEEPKDHDSVVEVCVPDIYFLQIGLVLKDIFDIEMLIAEVTEENGMTNIRFISKNPEAIEHFKKAILAAVMGVNENKNLN